MEKTGDSRMRELDRRAGDGLDVALLWEPATDDLYVAVADLRTRKRFRIRVEASKAVDAFNHPYAYAAPRGFPGSAARAGAEPVA